MLQVKAVMRGKLPDHDNIIRLIEQDLHRTCIVDGTPLDSEHHCKIRRVLLAYANRNQRVGYCQVLLDFIS
jgi:hypothetical protein